MSKIKLGRDESCLSFVLSDPIGWICYKYCQIMEPEWFEATKQEIERKHKEARANSELNEGGVEYGT